MKSQRTEEKIRFKQILVFAINCIFLSLVSQISMFRQDLSIHRLRCYTTYYIFLCPDLEATAFIHVPVPLL